LSYFFSGAIVANKSKEWYEKYPKSYKMFKFEDGY